MHCFCWRSICSKYAITSGSSIVSKFLSRELMCRVVCMLLSYPLENRLLLLAGDSRLVAGECEILWDREWCGDDWGRCRDRAIITSAGFSLPFLIDYATYQARHLYMPLHISSPSCFFIALRILSPRQHTYTQKNTSIVSFILLFRKTHMFVCCIDFFWSFFVVVVVVVVVSIKVRLLHFIWV